MQWQVRRGYYVGINNQAKPLRWFVQSTTSQWKQFVFIIRHIFKYTEKYTTIILFLSPGTNLLFDRIGFWYVFWKGTVTSFHLFLEATTDNTYLCMCKQNSYVSFKNLCKCTLVNLLLTLAFLTHQMSKN